MPVKIYKAFQENDDVLWPEQRSKEWLTAKRKVMPRSLFDAQYQNDPSGMKGVRYDIGWLKFYNDKQIPPLSTLEGIVGCDPAYTEDKRNDYFSMCVGGLHQETNVLYILAFIYGNIPATRHLQWMYQNFNAWVDKGLKIRKVILESVGPQLATSQALVERARWGAEQYGAKLMMPLEIFPPAKSQQSKEERFDSMLPYLENGSVKFLGEETSDGWDFTQDRGFQEFRNEWVSFPKGRRDDVLDSLFIVVNTSVTSVLGYQIHSDFEGSTVSEEDDLLKDGIGNPIAMRKNIVERLMKDVEYNYSKNRTRIGLKTYNPMFERGSGRMFER